MIINPAFTEVWASVLANLLAQQCCECNHICVMKYFPACWHVLKALLSYVSLQSHININYLFMFLLGWSLDLNF